MRYYITAGIVFLIFLLSKLHHVGVRTSDTNVYVLAAQQVLEGKILYRDIFLTNAPLFPYISALYTFFINGNVSLFYWTPFFEIAGICFFLFKILEHELKSKFWGVLGVAVYLNTFIIMASSNHQTGVFSASLFATAAYFFALKKRFYLVGAVLGLMVMVKGYFLPVAVGITLFYGFKNYKHGIQIVTVASIAVLIVLLPTLILAREAFLAQIFGYTLQRTAGLDKGVIISFFIKSHWLLMLCLVPAVFFWKKTLLPFLILILSSLFLYIYKDIYFFYINILMPFLIIASVLGIALLTRKYTNEFLKLIVIALFAVHILLTWQTYFTKYHVSGEVQNYDALVKLIKDAKPEVLYGEADIAPAFSYSTGIPLLNDVIDTNTNFFRSGILNEKKMTKDFFEKKGIFITYGADYPALNFQQAVVSEAITTSEVKKRCKILKSQPIITESAVNRLQIFKCY